MCRSSLLCSLDQLSFAKQLLIYQKSLKLTQFPPLEENKVTNKIKYICTCISCTCKQQQQQLH